MPSTDSATPAFRPILGVRFYAGDVDQLLRLTDQGGLIAVPSAPVLVDLKKDPAHRAAVEGCDFAITDSGFMVLLWLLLKQEKLPRISGLRYLRALLQRSELKQAGATFWVMPSAPDAAANMAWLQAQRFAVSEADTYLAPLYPAGELADRALLAQIETRRPRYVFLNLGGGVQERLGYFLRKNLSYRPAIICTGAAIAFLSGRQADIPVWADRLMLGWLIRTLQSPGRFLPRYWRATQLAVLLVRHGEKSVAAP